MVLPTLARAGMEMVTVRLAIGLAGRGHRVSVACIEDSGPLAPALEAAGIEVRVVPARGLSTLVWAPALIAFLAERRLDVVHTHSGTWLKGAQAARAARVPAVIHTEHGLLDQEPWYSRVLKQQAGARTSTVVAVSNPLRQYLIDVARLPASKISTIPNGIDTAVFAPGASEARARLPDRGVGRLVIGCVARFEPVKNHELLLRAFCDAYRVHNELLLVLVGDGTLRPSLEELAGKLGIAEAVAFVGDQEDTAPWYRAFDAFALSSHAEGTSMSILEAMASACAVLATDVGGNAALLAGQECGRLVPPGDRTALASAILDVAASPELRQRLGTSARDRANRHYSQRAMVERYEALYREVLH